MAWIQRYRQRSHAEAQRAERISSAMDDAESTQPHEILSPEPALRSDSDVGAQDDLGIQFGAQLRLSRCALADEPRDDAIAVITAILDEHLVRVVAGHDDAGDEDAGHRGLQRRRIVLRNAG